MAISTTGIMKDQLMREPLDTTPEAGMEGGVNRPSIVADLMSAMKDLDFRQLMEQYAAMSGQNVSMSRPLTNQMMKEEHTPLDETDMGRAMKQRMQGEPLTPVLDPNKMPSLKGMYAPMPVLPGNPNPPLKSLYEQNLGLMQQQPMEI